MPTEDGGESSGSDEEEGHGVEEEPSISTSCGRTIATDDEWCSWLREDLRSCPAWESHSEILEECAAIATRWRARFWADRPLWNRVRRGRRLAKELAEAAPVLQRARAAVAVLQPVKVPWLAATRAARSLSPPISSSSLCVQEDRSRRPAAEERLCPRLISGQKVADATRRLLRTQALPEGGPPLVILDLCSGFGYLAMFLSELLQDHAARVAKIVLVDIRWPPHGVTPQPHHLSDKHLTTAGWPIRLTTSRCDLKCASDRRNLARTFLAQGAPAMLLGVHLCGVLSVRAVELFNEAQYIVHYMVQYMVHYMVQYVVPYIENNLTALQ